MKPARAWRWLALLAVIGLALSAVPVLHAGAQPAPTDCGLRNDLIFYDRNVGAAFLDQVDGSGQSTDLQSYSWRRTWTRIIPLNANSDCWTDLLFYEMSTGQAELYANDGWGNFRLLQQFQWRTTWGVIRTVNVNGDNITDLLFYESATGQAEIYTGDGRGNIHLLRAYQWRTTWSQILGGMGTPNDWERIFFYERGSGHAELYSIDNQGNLTLLRWYTLRGTWLVTTGQFGPAGDTIPDLIFYDPRSDVAELFTLDTSGNLIHQWVRSWSTSDDRTWVEILPLELDTLGGNEMLFYAIEGSPVNVDIYNTGTTNEASVRVQILARNRWGQNWSQIVPGRFY
jgi:hypothetical protein